MRVAGEPPKYAQAPLEKVSLEALLQIEKKLAEIERKHKEYETVKKPFYDARVEAYVGQLENELRQLREEAEPLTTRNTSLWKTINSQLIGHVRRSETLLDIFVAVGKSWLSPNDNSIYYNGCRFRPSVQSEIAEHRNISAKLQDIFRQERLIRARISKPDVGTPPRPPSHSFLIRDQLNVFVVDVDSIDRTLLTSMLEERQKIERDEQETHNELKAKARAYDDEQREYAKSVRNKIKRQLHEYPNCPYCGIPLAVSQAHADHIYPVAFGGLSTIKNMVFVCQACNKKKKTRTLREFINENGLDEEFVFQNLEKLRKKF